MRTRLAFVLASVIAAACGSSGSPAPGGAPPPPSSDAGTPPPPDPSAPPLLGYDCDPMVPTECGMPFPSSVYLVDDPNTKTGKHVAFGKTSLPMIDSGARSARVDPSAWTGSDGFSPGQAPMTHLPGATVTGLATPDTIASSITASSPTILLDTSTGMLVPHWAELDESYPNDDRRAFMIRPAVRLSDATRYVVAIRHVVDAGGEALPPTPVFQALRDGTPSQDPSVDRRRALYADIFAKLAAAGVDKSDLQVAWDYTTASRDNNTAWLVHMRDDALATVGTDGPAYTVDSVQDNPSAHIRRMIKGTMTVPLYLDMPDPGCSLHFGPDGLPAQNGTAGFPFTVMIPNSAVSGKPGAILENGHGLFGSQNEGAGGYLAEVADLGDYVTIAVDMIGFSNVDEAYVANAVAGDVGQFRHAVDREDQGVLNHLLAVRMMKGKFAADPNVTFNGASAIDTTRAYYRGDSQGGIMGATIMAVSTDVTRGLLGEPGMPYDLLLNRSTDASPFFTVLRSAYRDPMDVQIALGLMQMFWDRAEPDGFAPYIRQNLLPNTPAHEILMHVAIGDHQVTPLGAHIMARAIGAPDVRPVNRDVFGIMDADPPVTGAGMIEYDFGLPPAPITNVPMTAGSDPHDVLRTLTSAEQESIQFFTDGTITTAPCGTSPCSQND